MAETRKALNLAARIAAVQAEIAEIEKSGYNPHFKYYYAQEPDIMAAVKPLFQKHGIALTVSTYDKEVVPVENRSLDRNSGEVVVTFDNILFISQLYTLVNVDDPQDKREIPWEASARVSDKALFAAQTTGMRYFLQKNFLIETPSEDVDHTTGDSGASDADELTAEQTKALAEIKAEPTKGSQVVIDFLPKSYNRDNPMDLWTMVHEDRKTVAYLRDKGREKFIREVARILLEAYPAPEGEEPATAGPKAVMIDCPACGKESAAYDNRPRKLAGAMKSNAPNLSCSKCGYKKWPSKDEVTAVDEWIAGGRPGYEPQLSIEGPEDEDEGVQETLTDEVPF